MSIIWLLVIIFIIVLIVTAKRVEVNYEHFIDPFSIYLQRCSMAKMARWNEIHRKQFFRNYYEVPQIYKE